MYQPEGDLKPFGQIWRKEERSKPVAFGTNRKGREESSQAAEIKAKLPENREENPHNQNVRKKIFTCNKSCWEARSRDKHLVSSSLWWFWLVHRKPTRKGAESQDNKNSLCKPEFRMSWGDKVLTEERERKKKRRNKRKNCRAHEHKL